MPNNTQEQLTLEIPKDRKDAQVIVKLGPADISALASGMALVGETNKSSYIRRLIHEHKGGKNK